MLLEHLLASVDADAEARELFLSEDTRTELSRHDRVYLHRLPREHGLR